MTKPRAPLSLAFLVLWSLVPFAAPDTARAADRPEPSDQVQSLASCHGHYIGVVEHSRLMTGENDAARLRSDMLQAMMNAFVSEHAQDRAYAIAIMNARVQGRSRMRNLFSTAEFDQDMRRRRLALGQIRRLLNACDSLLLDPRFHGLSRP